ncbi:Or13a family protein [Megaselia abdita]
MFKWYYPQDSSGRPVNFVHWHTILYKSTLTWPKTNFLMENFEDIRKFSACFCNVNAKINGLIRFLYLLLNSNKIKKVFDMFYTSIYIHENEHSDLNKISERKIRMLFSMCNKFFIPMGLYALPPIIALIIDPFSQTKPFVYPSVFPYDAQSVGRFLFVNLSFTFIGIFTVTLWNAEDVFISIIMSYTQARYQMLYEELDGLCNFEGNIKIYRSKLKLIMKNQQILQRCKDLSQDLFSFSMFIAMAYATLHFCMISFVLTKIGFEADSVKYLSWMLVQILEIFLLCYFCQMASDAADGIKDRFYFCGWENLLYSGADKKDILDIVRKIQYGIARSSRPTVYKTWYYWDLSLQGFKVVLSTSLSYFMFLNTLDN